MARRYDTDTGSLLLFVTAYGTPYTRLNNSAVRLEGAQVGSALRSHQQVALPVQGEVIGAREAALAIRALERLGSGVFAVMTCQLVGTCELPRAAFP